MRLLAISDLHVGHPANREAWLALADYRDDWLILAGDLGDTEADLAFVLEIAVRRFARVLWVPGNHELWTDAGTARGGRDKYEALVARCRALGVLTPEDPYALWPGPGGPHLIALMFLLYDYSFRPAGVPLEGALAWAAHSGVACADEYVLDPYPHATRQDWCAERCRITAPRLAAAAAQAPLVLVNHFPLIEELARIPRHPRFSLWCGTTATRDWHTRFDARVVVSGHLHMPSTRWIDGVRFEEVSYGYPHQRRLQPGCVAQYLRQILPAPAHLGQRPEARNAADLFSGSVTSS